METPGIIGTERFWALHVKDGAARPVEDALVEEGALQIAVDGAPFSMTMRTPGDDACLALGLLLAEGMIGGMEDVLATVETPASGGAAATVSLSLAPREGKARQAAPRRLVSNASCGVCGMVSAADLAAPPAVPDCGRLDIASIPALESRMRAAQALFSRTGGCHAAALFGLEGNLLVLKEDVGRHNAVDKAVGHLLRGGRLGEAAVLFISGRVSYEIVTKAAKAGIGFLLAVSAPSTLAASLCEEAGIALAAFCRGGRATVYSHPERFRWPLAPENAADAADAGDAAGGPGGFPSGETAGLGNGDVTAVGAAMGNADVTTAGALP